MGAIQVNKKYNDKLIIALAGNPNCGKTSIFNALTGARQHVGNWPGVTVEKKEGRLIHEGKLIHVIDLPGTYSLGAFSEDEKVARDFILNERPDVVIDVVNASNLERNLYLTIQFLEMDVPVVIALNMMDEARAQNIEIDVERLSRLLGVPVVPTIAIRDEGIKELIEEATSIFYRENTVEKGLSITYGREVDDEIKKIKAIIKDDPILKKKFNHKWLAIKLLEGDDQAIEEVSTSSFKDNAILEQVHKSVSHLKEVLGDEPAAIIADRRYAFIKGVARRVVKKSSSLEERVTLSDRIDSVVTSRIVGIPIFLLCMLGIFVFTFALGEPASSGIELFFESLTRTISRGLRDVGASELLISFLVDGVIGGVGSVLVFIPPIFLLFLAISFLEDCGYMARAAYIMDRTMNLIGLQGKSFIPLIIGFGCNVPGVMATRTLKDKKEKLNTILISPLIPCSARLPVYMLFVGAFFPANKGLVLFSIYLMGIILAMIMGRLFRKFLFEGETSPLVMELPPYRLPTLKGTFIHMWARGNDFLQRAGTIIFGAAILMWFLSNLPLGVEYAGENSLIGRLGAVIVPVLKPLGFGSWQAAVALIFGVFAKEVIVSTLSILYGVGGADLTSVIINNWTPLSAYAFMIMVLIYSPCVATIAAIKRETNSWGWTIFTMAYNLILGWTMAFLVFNIGRLIVKG